MNRAMLLLLSSPVTIALMGSSGCEDLCTGQPIPGTASVWTECQLYSETQTITVHLTNDSDQTLYYLTSCGGAVGVQQQTPEGWTGVPPAVDCVCWCAEWNALPPGSSVDVPILPLYPGETGALSAGTYRASFFVGWGCAATGMTEDPTSECAQTDDLYSEAFEVIPSDSPMRSLAPR